MEKREIVDGRVGQIKERLRMFLKSLSILRAATAAAAAAAMQMDAHSDRKQSDTKIFSIDCINLALRNSFLKYWNCYEIFLFRFN